MSCISLLTINIQRIGKRRLFWGEIAMNTKKQIHILRCGFDYSIYYVN
jgi:hypothetical protein